MTNEAGELVRKLPSFAQLGITMMACVFVGVFLGRLLDRLLDTGPWLLLVFSLLGAAAAIREIAVMGKKDR